MPEINIVVEYIRFQVQHLRALMESDEGASVVEYGLIVSLIAAAVVSLVGALGGKIVTAFGKINAAL